MKRGIKHGQMPGQLHKQDKINLIEKGHLDRDNPEPNRRKAFVKVILMKERAVLKRRFQRQLQELSD